MGNRIDTHSLGEQSANELCLWLTVIAGVILCLWK
jgi:hypothetical protein